MYSTLALEKEREIVKEETALRKEKEAVCCYAVQGCIHTYTCTCMIKINEQQLSSQVSCGSLILVMYMYMYLYMYCISHGSVDPALKEA